MHIIIDRTLTMYSLHDTCKLIVTASLHRKDNPGCLRAVSTPTHGYSLFIYLHQGLIEPPKAARGHATRTDGEIQHVTKFKFT